MLRFLAELPVRAIAWVSDSMERSIRLIGRAFQIGDFEDGDHNLGIGGLVKKALRGFFVSLAQLLIYPFAGFFFRGHRLRAFLLSIPFFTVFFGMLLVWVTVSMNRERIFSRYLARVQSAYSKQDGKLGRRYAFRWIADQEYANSERKFLYSLVEMQAGNTALAEEILEYLSPEDDTGLGLAHYWRAGKYANRIESESLDQATRNVYLNRFRWHLQHASGVSSGQIQVLEAMSAFWDGRTQDAESKYREVWQQDPFQSLGFAALLKSMGEEQKRQEVLKNGIERLTTLLRSDPWNRVVRLQLMLCYEAIGDWSRAELVTMEGYQIHKDPESSLAYRDFLDRRANAALKEPVSYRELAYCLVRVLRTQGATPRGLRLASQSLIRSEEGLSQLQRELNQWLVEGLDLPIVHMCLAIC
ncbi:MAG: tetratricopeptide repeat protein, partial [Pirellula sp.]